MFGKKKRMRGFRWVFSAWGRDVGYLKNGIEDVLRCLKEREGLTERFGKKNEKNKGIDKGEENKEKRELV